MSIRLSVIAGGDEVNKKIPQLIEFLDCHWHHSLPSYISRLDNLISFTLCFLPAREVEKTPHRSSNVALTIPPHTHTNTHLLIPFPHTARGAITAAISFEIDRKGSKPFPLSETEQLFNGFVWISIIDSERQYLSLYE